MTENGSYFVQISNLKIILECVTIVTLTTFDEMCLPMIFLIPEAVGEAVFAPAPSNVSVSGNRETKHHGGTN